MLFSSLVFIQPAEKGNGLVLVDVMYALKLDTFLGSNSKPILQFMQYFEDLSPVNAFSVLFSITRKYS